jgi:hypothetical protein
LPRPSAAGDHAALLRVATFVKTKSPDQWLAGAVFEPRGIFIFIKPRTHDILPIAKIDALTQVNPQANFARQCGGWRLGKARPYCGKTFQRDRNLL